jgi:signal transduction histidine kinase
VGVRQEDQDDPGGTEDNANTYRAFLRVSDQGISIPPEDIRHVFEQFRRGVNISDIGGSGVGLCAVRLLVEQHGGTVGAESEEGRGSTSSVRTSSVRLPLPRSQLAEEVRQVPANAA